MALFKKILLAVGGVLLLLILTAGISVYLMLRKEKRETQGAIVERRSQKKFHVGDAPHAVRLRAGVADTAMDFGHNGKEERWFYLSSTGGFDAVVVFDSLKRVDRIFTVGDYLWTPEDGLDPDTYSDVDGTLLSFQKTLGIPCDTSFAADSTYVRFYYPLSQKELDEDSVYDLRQRNPFRESMIVRLLQVDLTKGRHVQYHGWGQRSKDRCFL